MQSKESNYSLIVKSPYSAEANEEQDQQQETCSTAMLVLLSGPKFATCMAWSAQWAGLSPYLEGMLPSYAVQVVAQIGPISGILLAPTIGVLTESCTSRWGRRRPFLLFGAVAIIICWTLMGFTKELGELCGDYGNAQTGSRYWTAFFAILFYIWMDITLNIIEMPAQLIISDFAGNRQTTGAAIGQAANSLGSLVVGIYIYAFGPAHNNLHWFLGMLSVLMLSIIALICICAKETPLSPLEVKETICKKIGSAMKAIYVGVRALSKNLCVFCVIFFCSQYGWYSYIGAKGAFFGTVVYDGEKIGAANCGNNCTKEQELFNDGVQLAGGITDIIFSAFGYIFSLMIPYFVRKLTAKWFLVIAIFPQVLLIAMAFCKYVPVNVLIVILSGVTQKTLFTLMVPIILNDIGGKNDGRLGLYLGAINSANCVGQILSFTAASILVTTSLGYALPIFVGGILSFAGMATCFIFFKANFKNI